MHTPEIDSSNFLLKLQSLSRRLIFQISESGSVIFYGYPWDVTWTSVLHGWLVENCESRQYSRFDENVGPDVWTRSGHRCNPHPGREAGNTKSRDPPVDVMRQCVNGPDVIDWSVSFFFSCSCTRVCRWPRRLKRIMRQKIFHLTSKRSVRPPRSRSVRAWKILKWKKLQNSPITCSFSWASLRLLSCTHLVSQVLQMFHTINHRDPQNKAKIMNHLARAKNGRNKSVSRLACRQL